MKTITLLTLFSLPIFAFAQGENPGSLWNDTARNPFTGHNARTVGDVLTILISESSSSTATASTSNSKTSSAKVNAGLGPILSAIIPNLETGSSSSNAGSGSTVRTGRLSARLTVIVKQILPNGNLVIEGTRFIQMNKETQKILISGIIRREDIRFDNTILSEFIADANIKYDGKGTVGDSQRKGIITSLLGWLF